MIHRVVVTVYISLMVLRSALGDEIGLRGGVYPARTDNREASIDLLAGNVFLPTPPVNLTVNLPPTQYLHFTVSRRQEEQKQQIIQLELDPQFLTSIVTQPVLKAAAPPDFSFSIVPFPIEVPNIGKDAPLPHRGKAAEIIILRLPFPPSP